MSQLQQKFLTLILPKLEESDVYCVSYVSNGHWRDKAVTSIDTIINTVTAKSNEGLQTYYAMSTFIQGWHQTVSHGKSIWKFRTIQNVSKQKALWLDIDCGKKSSTYPNATAALEELVRFLDETSLPTPLIVLSGRGLHVYWPFSEAVDNNVWQSMSSNLERLTRQYELKDVDPAITTRIQGVLRVPGTVNYKTTPPISVEVLEWGTVNSSEALDLIIKKALKISDENGILSRTATPTTQLPGLDETAFAEVAEYKNRIKIADNMLSGCAQILDMGFSEQPAWYSALSVLKFCELGSEWADKLSALCEDKYDSIQVARYYEIACSSETGPTLCSTFNKLSPGVCTSCKNWGKIKTPLQLAVDKKRYISDKAPLITNFRGENEVRMDMPEQKFEVFEDDDFKVVPGVGCFWTPPGKDGDPRGEILINHNEVYIHAQRIEQTDTGTKRFYVIRRKCNGHPSVDCIFSVDHDWDKKGRWLAHNGLLPINPKKHLGLMETMMSTMMSKMRHYLPEITTQKHFGWNYEHDSYDGFILGDKMYTTQGTHLVNLDNRASQQLMRDFPSSGTLESWKELPTIYKLLDQKIGQLFMCAAFTTPFMKFGGNTATNMVMSIWDSRGGKGKTTLLRMINSVWGHPKMMMSKHNDTLSARYQTLGVRKNLPMCVDELTMMNDDDLAELILELANGVERRKSKSGGESLQETALWDTITFVSSNRSVHELMNQRNPQTTAEEMRVVELQCEFSSYSGTNIGVELERTLRLMDTNYGVAGAYFLEKCFSNPEVFEQVRNESAEFDARVRLDSSERFWTFGTGMILAVGRLCKKWGLLDYDMNELENFVRRDILEASRTHISNGRTDSYLILNEYFTEQINNTLIVKEAARPKSSKDMSLKDPLLDDYVVKMPRDYLNIRLELDTYNIQFRVKPFQTWCQNNNLSVSGIMNDLAQQRIWNPKRGKTSCTLGKGVQAMDKGQVICYLINGDYLRKLSENGSIKLLEVCND